MVGASGNEFGGGPIFINIQNPTSPFIEGGFRSRILPRCPSGKLQWPRFGLQEEKF